MHVRAQPRDGVRGLEPLLATARRVRLLDAEEERVAALSYRASRDPAAAQRIVVGHLPLVLKIARGYRRFGLSFEDLVAEGTVGLMNALEHFEPERGVRFNAYAAWWVRAAMNAYVLRFSSIVRFGTTRAERRLFFRLGPLKRKFGAPGENRTGATATKRIARLLDVAEADVVAIDERLSGPDRSLNAPIGADGEATLQDMLIDPAETQETICAQRSEAEYRRGLVANGLARLNARERLIVTERWLAETPPSLRDLGQRLGVSCERVRQIEQGALAKLHRFVTGRAGHRGGRDRRGVEAPIGHA